MALVNRVAPRPSKRLHYLDALRGVAAISVVIYHYVLDQIDQQALHGVQHTFAAFLGYTVDLGKYGVVLFFLISGFIIPSSLGPAGDRIGRFCISRVFRLYPLYWLAVAVGILLPWPALQPPPSAAAIAANFTMLQGYLGQRDIVGTAWTLQIELTFYGFCAVMAFRHWLTSPRACTWASLGFIAVALVLAILRNVLVIKFPTALPLALSLMFFGTVWRQATLDGNASAKRVAPWLLGVIIVMIVPISVVGYSHDFGYHEHWQPYVICYSAAIATFVLCTTRLQITWRPLVWLGQISYSIYLLHPLIAAACYRLGFRSSIMPGGALVYAVTLAAIAVACSWLTYRFIEQPGIRTGRWLIQVLRAGPVGASGSTTPASH